MRDFREKGAGMRDQDPPSRPSDNRDKIEVPDPLVVEDLISDKLNNRRKLAWLIKQYRDIKYPYTV